MRSIVERLADEREGVREGSVPSGARCCTSRVALVDIPAQPHSQRSRRLVP
jgi:hypothetical protein